MNEYAKSQYKLLKQLKRHNLKRSKLADDKWEDIVFLRKEGCIRYEAIYKDDPLSDPIDIIVIIQPKGKAVYDTYIRGKCRWFMPVIISILALIISVFALFKSSKPINTYLSKETIGANNVCTAIM